MRTIVIGDVHGCLSELRVLIEEAIVVTPTDTVVFVGDLVDKGPDSDGVVRYVRTLPNVVLVLGNHEEKHARFREQEKKGGSTSPHAERLRAVTALLSPGDVAFLDSAVLYHALPNHGAIVVHGGFSPSIETLPPTKQFWDLTRPNRGHFGDMIRVRNINADGKMVPLDSTEPATPWYLSYDGRFGHVFYGHEPHTSRVSPLVANQTTALDMGCVHGGNLCAAVMNPGQPAIEADFYMVRGKVYAPPRYED